MPQLGETATARQIVGANIEVARKRMGLSQQEFGRRVEQWLDTAWTRQAVSLAESGKRAFGVDDLMGLSVGLRVSISQLLTPPPETTTVALASGMELPRVFVERDVLAGFGQEDQRERYSEHLEELDAVAELIAVRRRLLQTRLREIEGGPDDDDARRAEWWELFRSDLPDATRAPDVATRPSQGNGNA